jgi:hypothetical protein
MCTTYTMFFKLWHDFIVEVKDLDDPIHKRII